MPAGVIRVIDVKCPGSGEAAKNYWENLDLLRPHDEVKFVIHDRADYEYAATDRQRARADAPCAAVLFSPVHGVLEAKELAEWILADRLAVRLQLQAHKYIWDAQTRGRLTRAGGASPQRRARLVHGGRDGAAPTGTSSTR